MRKKSLLAAAVFAATVAGAGSGVALAGEITGTGEPITVHGRSHCAYSGLNDDPNEPGAGGRVQSFGQIVRQVGPIGGVPGVACNPTTELPE